MQMWQRMFETWQSQWMNSQPGETQPPSIEEAQRQWARYLESMASTFSEVMGTEEFSQALGKYMEQGLAWQERTAKQVNPQINALLRAAQRVSPSPITCPPAARWTACLPGSSASINYVSNEAAAAAVVEKLDDLEDEIRKLRSELSASRRSQPSRSRSARVNCRSACGQRPGRTVLTPIPQPHTRPQQPKAHMRLEGRAAPSPARNWR